MKQVLTLATAAALLAVAAQAQQLTTGGTAGTSVNDGANIGAGNHTGASVSTNADNPTAAGIRNQMGTKGTAQARQNTTMMNGSATNASGNVTTTPAEMGATGSIAGSTNTATQVAGAARLADVLPQGGATYRYYPGSKVYYSPGTQTYYYSTKGRWYSSASVPAGVKLGSSHNVRMVGKATAAPTNP